MMNSTTSIVPNVHNLISAMLLTRLVKLQISSSFFEGAYANKPRNGKRSMLSLLHVHYVAATIVTPRQFFYNDRWIPT